MRAGPFPVSMQCGNSWVGERPHKLRCRSKQESWCGCVATTPKGLLASFCSRLMTNDTCFPAEGGSVARGSTTLEPFTGAAPEELRRVATDARLFASLREGQQVRYVDPLDGMTTGTLVEKCRYGALVLREGDETVLGVGFSRVWPLAAGGEES